MNFHFDSTKLQFTGFGNLFSDALIASEDEPQDDNQNLDNDASTDKYVKIAYADISGNWPNQPLPLELVQLGFTVVSGAVLGITHVNVTFSGTAAGYQGNATSPLVSISSPGGPEGNPEGGSAPLSDTGAPSTPVDQTPPTVNTISPEDGATGVDVTSSISATFSEDMDTSTVSFAITPEITGSYTWTDNTVTFIPDSELDYEQTYTVTISSSATDAAGNELDGDGDGTAGDEYA